MAFLTIGVIPCGSALPLYVLVSFVCVRLFCKYSRRFSLKFSYPGIVRCMLFVLLFTALKTISVYCVTYWYGDMDKEKQDIIERRNYLVDKFSCNTCLIRLIFFTIPAIDVPLSFSLTVRR